MSFSFFEHKLAFFKHVREKHKERLDEVGRSHYYDNADDVVLVVFTIDERRPAQWCMGGIARSAINVCRDYDRLARAQRNKIYCKILQT